MSSSAGPGRCPWSDASPRVGPATNRISPHAGKTGRRSSPSSRRSRHPLRRADLPRVLVLYEREVNGYLRFQAASSLPVGVADPSLSLDDDGRVSAQASVDLNAVGSSQPRGALDPPSLSRRCCARDGERYSENAGWSGAARGRSGHGWRHTCPRLRASRTRPALLAERHPAGRRRPLHAIRLAVPDRRGPGSPAAKLLLFDDRARLTPCRPLCSSSKVLVPVGPKPSPRQDSSCSRTSCCASQCATRTGLGFSHWRRAARRNRLCRWAGLELRCSVNAASWVSGF